MKELPLGSQLISLGQIFFGRLANLFRQRARARKAFGTPARQRIRFEPLEARLLLSADLIGDNPFTFDAPANAAADEYTLRLNPGTGDLELLDGATLVASQGLAETTAVIINGEDGWDDTLTVDFAFGGFFTLDDGITFNGGAEGFDTLRVSGGEFTTVTHTLTTTGPELSGDIVYENGVNPPLTISYTGLEPIDMTGSTITDLVFNLPGTDDQAILEDDGTVANGVSQIRSQNASATFDVTTFSNTITTLTVNMGGDSGTFTVASLPDFTGALTIDGQGGTDSVTFVSATNLGSLTVAAESIDINQSISTTAVTAGAISLSGATVNLGANLSTDGGSVSIAGSTAVVIDAATVIIDTESGNNGNAGVVTFAGTGLIHADAAGRNLVINTDTSNVGSSNSAVTLAAFGDGGVAFVNNVTIDADDAATIGAAVLLPVASQIAGTLSITAGAITSNAAFTAGASTTISLTSDAAITDGNGSGANYVAASLSASAVTRIDVDTNVATLTAAVSGPGFINISDTAGGLTVNSATTSSGSITLNATGGNLTLTTVAAGGFGDVIASTTTSGSILVGNILAISNAVLLSSVGAIEESGADAGSDLSAAILDLFAVTGVGAAAQIEIDADTSAGEGLTANVSGPGAINLRDLDALLVLAATTTAGAINLESGGDLTLEFAIVASSLNLTAAGSITDGADADLDITGNARFDALGAITLGDQAGNVTNFGTLTVVGGAVAISEDSATVLSSASAVSSLILTSAGSITDDADADIGVIGSASFLAGANAITLGDQAGNVVNFGTLAFSGGVVSITEDSASVLASSTAGSLSIVSSSSITVNGALSTTEPSGSLALIAAGNTNVNANLNAGTGSISAPGAVVFSGVGTRTVSGETFSAGSISINNSAIATLNLNVATTVTGALNLSLGALAGTGDVMVNGTTTFTGGTMTGSGDTITLGALTINGNVNLDAGRLLDVRGGANWTAGAINLNPSSTGGAGSITNAVGSVFETGVDGGLIHGVLFGGEVGPAPLFTNAGEFRKSGGTGVTEIRAPFNNSGTVNTNSGTLNLTGSGDHTGSFSGAGTLQFAGGTHDLLAGSSVTTANATFTGNLASVTNVGGTYAVTGTTRVDIGLADFTDATLTSLGSTLILTGGTADLGASNQTVTTYSQSVASGANSVLSGTGNLTVNGTTTFTGGTMRGSGDTITLGALTINGNVNLDAGRLLDVRGGASWTGNINLNPSSTGGAGSLTNRVGSLFEADAGAVLIHGVLFGGESGPAPLFTNEGEFRKTGAGVTEIRAAFNNDGVVTVETGTLSLTSGGGTHTGSFSGAGTLQFAGGTHDLLAGSSVTTANATFTGNSGSVTNVGGTYAVTGTTRVDAGLADFTGATLTSLGNTLILTGGTVDLGASNQTVTTYSQNVASGSNSVLFGAGDLTVSGTTTFTGGTMRGSGDTITLGALVINGNVNLDAGRLLDVRGGANWTAGSINLNPSSIGGAGSITNRAGSVFEADAGAVLIHGVLFGGEVGPQSLFTNEGEFLKTGAGVTEIRTPFNNSGTVNIDSGTLNITGALTQTGTISVASGTTFLRTGGFTSSGVLQGNGTFNVGVGNVLINTGTVAPGAASGDTTGTLAITGNYAQGTNGRLDIEVGSTAADGFDVLAISGAATIASAPSSVLSATLVDGFSPVGGDRFQFMTFASRSGFFGTTLLPAEFFVDQTDPTDLELVFAQPTISINDVTLQEGNTGVTSFIFTASLSNPSSQTVIVNFSTADGTATVVGNDYVATSGSVIFTPGQTSQTIGVTVNGDVLFEPNESFAVNLGAAVNATIADGTGLGTIQNDDSQPTISINDVSLLEGNSGVTNNVFTVSLSNPSSQTVIVNFSTADGTATLAGNDYAPASGSVIFASGQTSSTISVAVNGDVLFEPNESFTVNLSAAVNAVIADGTGLGTILNDDTQPTISINDVSLLEGNSGVTNAIFSVSLSNPSSQTVAVNFSTADGTATLAGNDYVGASGSVIFTPGQTSNTISVTVNGDVVFEPNELFTVNLSTGVNATIADGTGIGRILNDDAAAGDIELYVDNPGDYLVTDDQGILGILDLGDIVTWNPGAGSAHGGPVADLIFGFDAFGTIQDAINAAAPSDTVRVAGGTFSELVSVDKSLDVLGNQFGVDARTRTGVPESIVDGASLNGFDRTTAFNITASNATVDGFTARDQIDPNAFNASIVIGTGTSGVAVRNNIITNNFIGLLVGSSSASFIERNLFDGNNFGVYAESTTGLTIDDNEFRNHTLNHPIILAALSTTAHTNLTVSDNFIHDNVAGVVALGINGGVFRGNTISTAGAAQDALTFGGANTGVDVLNNDLRGNLRGLRIVDFGFFPSAAPNSDIEAHFNDFSGNSLYGAGMGDEGGATDGYTGTLDLTCNWWGNVTGPTTLDNPGGSGVVLANHFGDIIDFQPWLLYGDANASAVGFQFPTSFTVTAQTADFTSTNNNYRRLVNAIDCLQPGQTVILSGTFDWTEANASAAWALGNDGTSGTADDFSLTVRPNLNNAALSAASLGSARIQGPGDLPGENLEGFLFFNGGDNQNWTISNLEIFDFDLSIGMFNGAGGADAYSGTQIVNNLIRVPADLNAIVAPADVNQNIGIHFSFGQNQTIQNNQIQFAGNGVSAGATLASSVGMQSNVSGGAVYDGLLIDNNMLRVLNAQSANPERILGIWENAHGHTSDITISNNDFINDAAGNDPSTNRQSAFRVTSHSSAATVVAYTGNTVDGANIGFEWVAGNNFAGNAAVRLWQNTISNSHTGVLVQSSGIANLFQNSITGSGVAGVDVVSGTLTGSGPAPNAVQENFISGGAGDAIRVGATAGPIGAIFNNDLSGNAGLGVNNQGLMLVNAAGNWWGTSTATGVAAEVSLLVDYSPWLDAGMDIAPGAAGFQGNFATLHVDDSSPQGASAGAIQEGIDLATGVAPTVIIEAGTYLESVAANKSGLTLDGAGGVATDVVIDPVVGDGVTVSADNVTIHDLRVTGGADGINASGVDSLTITNVQADGNTDDGFDLSTITGLGALSSIVASSNSGDGISLTSVGAVTLSGVTASGNANTGVRVNGAASFRDTDGIFNLNTNHGIQLIDIGGLVSLTRTTANDNDANNGTIGDGVIMTDGLDAGTEAIGSLLVVGGSFSDTAAAGGQRYGIRVGDGVGVGAIHSIGGAVDFQSDGAAGPLQHVSVTGNQSSGVEIEDGGTTASVSGNYSSNLGTGFTIASLSGSFTASGSTFSNNTGHGLSLASVGDVNLTGISANDNTGEGIRIVGAGHVTTDTVTATGNDPGVLVNGAASFSDSDGVYTGNDTHGIQLIDIAGLVSLTRTTANDNDADNNGTGDGVNMTDGVVDADTNAVGALSVTGGSFSNTADAGGQRFGIRVGDGINTGAVHSVGDTIVFQSDSGVGPLQHVSVTGNQISGVEIEDGGTTASFSGNGNYSSNSNAGVAIASLSGGFTAADSTFSSNVNHGIQLIDIGGLVSLTRVTANDNDANNGTIGDGVIMTDGLDAGTEAIGSLLVVGGSFSDTAAAGGQRYGIRVGDGVGVGAIHSIGGAVDFQSDGAAGPLQHVSVTGNQSSGVEIEDGGTTASVSGNYSSNLGTGFTIASLSGSFTASGSTFSNNTGHGLSLASVGDVNLTGISANDNTGEGIRIVGAGHVTTDTVTATGNDPGVLVNGAASFSDSDGVYTGNDTHGIQLIDIAGLVSLTRTTANDNDADNNGTGDGVNMTDGVVDADTNAVGALSVTGGSFSNTADAGGQRFGIRVGDGINTGAVHSVGDTIVFQSDSGVGPLQHVSVTGNQISGVEIEDGGTTASFSGNGNYSSNSNAGVAIASLSGGFTAADSTFSSNVNHGIQLIDIGGLVSLTRVTANDNDANNGTIGDGVIMTDGLDAGTEAIGSLLVVGGSFSDTAAAGGQRYGIRVGNGIGPVVHSVAGSVDFQSDVAAGVLQHVSITGNQESGVEIEDGGSSATFTNGTYSNNGGDGIRAASLATTLTVSGVTASGNTGDGLDISDGGTTAFLSGAFSNNASGRGVNLASDSIFVNGSLDSGTSAIVLTAPSGVFFTAGAVLHVDLGGTAAGQFTTVVISDAVTLDGTLDADVVGLFSLEAGDRFPFMTFGSLAGSFDNTLLPDDFVIEQSDHELALVFAPNDAPVANPDTFSVDEDGTLTISAPGVLGNDTDEDNDTLTAMLVSTTTNGALTFNSDGSFTYTPNGNFNGTDSFTYEANDGTADSNISTVTLTVNAVNDAPVANPDSFAVNEDDTLTVTAPGVLGNDTDVENSTLTVALVSSTTNGVLTFNSDGSLIYTPNSNFNGTDSFTYIANDGELDSDIATVTIAVNAVDDAPVAAHDAFSLLEDDVLVVAAPGVLGNDTDIDSATLTAILVSAPANGTVTLNADGSFTYTPNLNFFGSDSFTYVTNDGTDQSDVATVSIAVADTSEPDLVGAVEWVPPAVLTPGAKGQPDILVSNIGDASAPAPIGVSVYASADALFDPSDVLLDTKQTGPIPGGASRDLHLNFRFPGTLAPGDYFLLAVVDSANNVPESNEANNVAVGAQFHFAGNGAPAASGVSSFAESSFSGAGSGVVDWQAGLQHPWSAGLTPFAPNKPGNGVSPNVADFLISLSSAGGAQGGYDSLGSELLGKGRGKPGR